MQTSNKVFMVRPVNFAYNEETAVNNEFQKKSSDNNVEARAEKEFDDYVTLLKDNKVDVVVVQDSEDLHTPDSIFPNNWFSVHDTGELVLYSMFAPNRREERKEEFLTAIHKNCFIKTVIDFTDFEKENLFLEGTGSMVLDREHHIVYACQSIRTSEKLLYLFQEAMNYKVVLFHATGRNGMPIYHTNVMMCVGCDFAVVCLESIQDEKEKNELIHSLNNTGKEIIEISLEQMEHFAGNMLELHNRDNERLLVMSKCAKDSLNINQLDILEKRCRILSPNLTTIETNGGGSARCMLAELFA